MNFKRLFVCIFIPLFMGIVVGLITRPFMDYMSINKPVLAPPSVLFPIVWSLLYVLMGVSAYIVSSGFRVPSIYWTQLFVNGLWSIVFFVFKFRFLSFLLCVLLFVLVFRMIVQFRRINNVSGLLQIPYLIWVAFAGYLNLGIYILN